MLGIGSKPDPPSNINIILEGCTTAILKWERSKAAGFPVHKFRVQRRRLSGDYDPLFRNHSEMMTGEKCVNEGKYQDHTTQSQNDVCVSNELGRHMGDLVEYSSTQEKTCSANDENSNTCKSYVPPSTRNSLGWHTVYDQSGDPEFQDFGLERGHRGYQYRIQAWNAVGRSDWTIKEIKNWRQRNCHRLVNQRSEAPLGTYSFWSSIVVLPGYLYSLSRFVWGLFWGLFVVIGAILKVQRATVLSTAIEIDSIQTFVFRHINDSIKVVFGVDVIPSAFRETNAEEDGKRSHSVLVNQHKVAGYDQIQIPKKQTTARPKLAPPKAEINTSNYSFGGDSKHYAPKQVAKVNKSQNLFKLLKSRSAQKLSTDSEVIFDRNEEFKTTRNMSSTMSLCPDGAENIEDSVLALLGSREEIEDDINTRNPLVSTEGNTSSAQENMRNTPEVNDNHCIWCQKKFKLLKRKKHHCALCYASFCQHHGKTTHGPLIPCKVPGDCICNHCLQTTSQI